MDKCYVILCSYLCEWLGNLINTRKLTISTPKGKYEELTRILLTTWNSYCKRFTLREVTSILRLVPNSTLYTQWIKHSYIALQHAALFSIKFNIRNALSIRKLKYLTDVLRSESIFIHKFHLAKACKTLQDVHRKILITIKMSTELNLLTTIINSSTTLC